MSKEISGLTCDSRRVEPGFLFAALPGTRVDGRDYIDQALRRGAAALLVPPGTGIEPGAPPVALVTDDNPRRRFALMAARFYETQPPTVAAVTGTNGKTSVVSFLHRIWLRSGRRAASMGTLGLHAPGRETAGGLTTPDPADLHRDLRRLAEDGVECLAMEASSHGLAQYRLDGVRVCAAAFTNLSRDHLDYHGSMEAYLGAKIRLFAEVMAAGGTAVLNAADPHCDTLRRICGEKGHRIVNYGPGGDEVRLDALEALADGQALTLTVDGRSDRVKLPLIGAFQAENALCALALAMASGVGRDDAVGALEDLEPVPGRLQLAARHPNGAAVYVDYAHTPDALAGVLAALAPHARGRLVAVFGCGGERDPGKRGRMGRIAAGKAHAVIVTDDNPRGEEAAEIRRQVLAACPGAREIGDRALAIATAVAELEPEDILVIAGKGHEKVQIVGSETRPFDDVEVARAAVAEIGR